MVSLFKDSTQISIDSKYTLYLNKKIGNGAFGAVYQGTSKMIIINYSRD